MNNEPVAWMFRGYLYEKDPSDWTVHEHPDVPVIPLYTHPAKAEDDGKVCARCGAIAYDPVIKQTAKTLTDAEIMESCHAYHYTYNPDYLGFAREILKKAQE